MKEQTIESWNFLKNWISKNWKELLFFLMTWSIGWYLFFIVISKIDPNSPKEIFHEHWMMFYSSLFLLLLPFVSKIALGNILKIERELNQTKNELKDFKTTTQNQFQFITSNMTFLSQHLSNNINIYNQVPSASTLEEENEILNGTNKQKGDNEETNINEIKEELKFVESDEEWIWIFNLLKIRVQMEQFLRVILNKRTSIAQNSNLDIKYYSLGKLFNMYLDEYPEAINEKRPFNLFNAVANAAIHGQTINEKQYKEALELGVKILRNIKLRKIMQK